MSEDTLQKLALLKQMFEQGLITEEEYQARRGTLLDANVGTPPSSDPFVPSGSDSYQPSRSTIFDLESGLEIGPEDNRFRLVREIGGGAMGRVWLARDLEEEALEGGERYKALKVINPMLQDYPRALEALKREAVNASRLTHPNIINVYGWRQKGKDGWLFVVMEHLEGRDLDRLLEEEGNPGLG